MTERTTRALESLKEWDKNPRQISERGYENLKYQILRLGIYKPFLVTDDGTILGGNMRVKAHRELSSLFPAAMQKRLKEIRKTEITLEQAEQFIQALRNPWVSVIHPKNVSEMMEYALSDNDRAGTYDVDMLANEIPNLDLDMSRYSIDLEESEGLEELFRKHDPDQKHATLTDNFLVPPFTVLDTRQGYWQDRKREWLAMGIRSELGRDKNVQKSPKTPEYADVDMPNMAPATSVFDPVLCEIMYRWFCVPGGSVLDLFAGGSVRGIVAEKLGYHYTGFDLSHDQVEENRLQATEMSLTPQYYVGDSRELKIPQEVDMLFTCPPYEDLEVYSDDPKDLSTMSHEDFLTAYTEILTRGIRMLKDDRFAVVVVSEVRDKRGMYRSLVPNTIRIMEAAGAAYYNEAILVNEPGTLPLRIAKQFNGGRKLGRTHQTVVICYKGDPKKIKSNYQKLELSEQTQQKTEDGSDDGIS